MEPEGTTPFDILVRWEDDSLNVVRSSDVKLNGGRWRCGAGVSMLWKDGVNYTGKIVDMELVVSDSDSNDDVPLARMNYKRQRLESDTDTYGEDDSTVPLSRLVNKTLTQHKQTQPSTQRNQTGPFCSQPQCSRDAVVSCLNASCMSLVCEDHFVSENSCFVCDRPHEQTQPSTQRNQTGPSCSQPECSRDAVVSCLNASCMSLVCEDHFVSENSCFVCDRLVANLAITQEVAVAQDVEKEYPVEGYRREETVDSDNVEKTLARRKNVKSNRNKGLPYESEKTKKVMPSRELKGRCKGEACAKRSLWCAEISEGRREILFQEFWNIGELRTQRNWVHAHISTTKCPTTRKDDSRRTKTVHYNLPDKDGEKIPVCQTMFLHTLGISERFVRTVCSKVDENGVIDGEHRGGRVGSLAVKDAALRAAIVNHINSFPRTESHYCRKNTKREYLNSTLTISLMYSMYKTINPELSCDYTTYWKVFKSMNLSFHQPKKDLCGLCESYFSGTEEKRAELQHQMQKHLLEKEEVRKAKNSLKENPDPSIVLATFDLEQVIYLPKSNRCEVFYRRQLANYNFTVYNVKTKKCNAYLWHECMAKRGSNEIASCLFHFLQEKDSEGASDIHLFCDSCSGQNRNTILPSMLLYFIGTAVSVVSTTINFFEPHHGQNEGDSVHSSVERALRRHETVNLPSELAPIIRSSRTAPTYVKEITTEDVQDWKDLSRSLGILKVRQADDGKLVDWTTVKSVTVSKDRLLQIGFKSSHTDQEYSYLQIDSQRTRREIVYPPLAHTTPPKLSKLKYEDLMALIDCATPLISHPDHRNFYRNLPHS